MCSEHHACADALVLTARRASVSVERRVPHHCHVHGGGACRHHGVARTAAVPVGGTLVRGNVLLRCSCSSSSPRARRAGTIAAAVVQRGAGLVRGVCRQRGEAQRSVRLFSFRRFRAGRDVQPGAAGVVLLNAGAACGREAESAGVRAPQPDSPALVEPSGDPGGLWPRSGVRRARALLSFTRAEPRPDESRDQGARWAIWRGPSPCQRRPDREPPVR